MFADVECTHYISHNPINKHDFHPHYINLDPINKQRKLSTVLPAEGALLYQSAGSRHCLLRIKPFFQLLLYDGWFIEESEGGLGCRRWASLCAVILSSSIVCFDGLQVFLELGMGAFKNIQYLPAHEALLMD